MRRKISNALLLDAVENHNRVRVVIRSGLFASFYVPHAMECPSFATVERFAMEKALASEAVRSLAYGGLMLAAAEPARRGGFCGILVSARRTGPPMLSSGAGGAAMPDSARDRWRSLPAELAVVSGILAVEVAILVPAVVLARDHSKGGRPPQRSPYELWLLHFIDRTWNGPIAMIGSIVLGATVAVMVYFVAVALRKLWQAVV